MSGNYFNPIKREFLNLSGGTVSGSTLFSQNLSASTYYSGSTPLENIIQNIATNTTNSGNYLSLSGGTVSGETNFSGGLSASTIYSGSTDLYDIFQQIGVVDGVQTVGQGTNIQTGGTVSNPVISTVSSPSFNNITFSGQASGGNILATSITATTYYGDGSNLSGVSSANYYTTAATLSGTIVYFDRNDQLSAYTIQLSALTDTTRVQPGTNIQTGGTVNTPVVSMVASPSFNDITFSGQASGGNVFATSISASTLTSGRMVFAGAGGVLSDNSNLTYNTLTNTLSTKYIVVGEVGQTGNTAVIHGDVLVIGSAISGFTSELYIQDNLIELNYNPTASTESTSLGSGFSIQDGSGVPGTSVFLDVRGTTTGLSNRYLTTNIEGIRIRETGTVSSPNGDYLLASGDLLDGGTF
jgi:hypothetical protein